MAHSACVRGACVRARVCVWNVSYVCDVHVSVSVSSFVIVRRHSLSFVVVRRRRSLFVVIVAVVIVVIIVVVRRRPSSFVIVRHQPSSPSTPLFIVGRRCRRH